MEISLKHKDRPEIYLLHWNQDEGTLQGDSELINEINTMANWALEDGYIAYPIIPSVNYPVTNPLKKIDELTLVCSILGYRSPALPIPEFNLATEFDGWVRDEHGNIIDQVLF